jgi:hypothetical protein
MAEQLDLISENIIDDQEKSGSLICDIPRDHHPVTINIAFLDVPSRLPPALDSPQAFVR